MGQLSSTMRLAMPGMLEAKSAGGQGFQLVAHRTVMEGWDRRSGQCRWSAAGAPCQPSTLVAVGGPALITTGCKRALAQPGVQVRQAEAQQQPGELVATACHLMLVLISIAARAFSKSTEFLPKDTAYNDCTCPTPPPPHGAGVDQQSGTVRRAVGTVSSYDCLALVGQPMPPPAQVPATFYIAGWPPPECPAWRAPAQQVVVLVGRHQPEG